MTGAPDDGTHGAAGDGSAAAAYLFSSGRHVCNCGGAVPPAAISVAASRMGGRNRAVEDTTTAVAAAPDHVGPRLKQLRARRGVTLTALSEATGISESTLTRLGRPTCT